MCGGHVADVAGTQVIMHAVSLGGRCMVARGSVCTTNGGIVGTQCVVAIDMHNDKYLFNAPKRIGYPTQCTATSGELPLSHGTRSFDAFPSHPGAPCHRGLHSLSGMCGGHVADVAGTQVIMHAVSLGGWAVHGCKGQRVHNKWGHSGHTMRGGD